MNVLTSVRKAPGMAGKILFPKSGTLMNSSASGEQTGQILSIGSWNAVRLIHGLTIAVFPIKALLSSRQPTKAILQEIWKRKA